MIALLIIESMGNGNGIKDEHKMMNTVKQLMGNAVTEVGGSNNDKNCCNDTISRAHNFRSKFGANGFISIGTKQAKEGKEHDGGQDQDDTDCVSKMNM